MTASACSLLRLLPVVRSIARFSQDFIARPTHLLTSALCALFLCSTQVATGEPFTARFDGIVTTLATGGIPYQNPGAVVVDPYGTVYVADSGHNSIVKITPNGAGFPLAITGLATPLNDPAALALDSAGDLFIADQNNNRIVEVSPSGVASVIATQDTEIGFPQGVAVDASNNLYISDSLNNRIVEVTQGGNVSVLPLSNLGSPLNNPLGLAVDPAGNLYIADSNNNRIVEVAASSGNATVLPQNPFPLQNPVALAVDGLGNLYVAESGDSALLVVLPDATESYLGLGDAEFDRPRGVAVAPSGTIYVADTGNNQAVSISSTSVNFPHTVLFSSQAQTMSLPFEIGDGTTVGAVKVFTEGTELLDFLSLPTSSCMPGSSGVACTVDVRFQPAFPGLRRGAVVVYDNSTPPIPLISVPLSGMADAPVAAVSPGIASVISTGEISTVAPFQLALDGAGDIYSANYDGTIVKIQPGGAASQVSIPVLNPAVAQIAGVAIDGAGNLYFSDYDNGRIEIISANGYASTLQIAGLATGLQEPSALFFDTAGNLYIAAFVSGRIVKVTQLSVAQTGDQESTGEGSVLAIPDSLNVSTPSGVAVDAEGTVYVADRGAGIIKVTSSGVATSLATPGLTLAEPEGVTVDGMGNVYIADTGNNRIVAVPRNGIASVVALPGLPGSLATPLGVTIDPSGNLLIPDFYNNRIIKVDSSAASLTFPDTNVSADTPSEIATVTNLGDVPLNFSQNASYTAAFSQGLTDPNPCISSTSLSPGGFCDVPVIFSPQTGGQQSANILTFDNSLNLGSTQSISVSGNGIVTAIPTSVSVSVSPSPVKSGSPAIITASVRESTRVDIAVIPTGVVQFTDSLGSTITPLGPGTLVNGVTALTAQLSGVGVHTITAGYAGVLGSFLPSLGTTAVTVQAVIGISWGHASTSITYGDNLSSVLIATASDGNTAIPGLFTYTATPSGGSAVAVSPSTRLGAGTYTITASFTPTNTTTFVANHASLALTVSKATGTATLTATPNPALITSRVAFVAAASSSAGAPTGSFSFYDGKTLLGTGDIASGAAAFSTADLAVGQHSITAVYSGDGNFAPVTSSSLAEAIQDFDLSIGSSTSGGSSPSQTVAPGGTATYTLAIGPVSGTIFPAPITLSLSGLPTGAVGTITPDTLAAGSGLTDVVLKIVLPTTTARVPAEAPFGRELPPTLLGILLLPFAARFRRSTHRFRGMLCSFFALFGMGIVIGLAGCGAGSKAPAEQSYNLVVTATSGSVVHSTTLKLIVQ